MAKPAGAVLGFALIVLLGAISIPAAVSSVDSTEVESSQIDVGDTVVFDQQIEVSVIDSTNTEATVRVVDEETGESIDAVIPEGNTTQFSFSNGDIHITNSISTNAGATLLVEYPSVYGFSPAAKIVGDYLEIILATMFFLAILAFVGIRT